MGDHLSVVAQRLERGRDIGLERGARIASGRDHVRSRRAELGGVVGRDDRAERMAEHDETIEVEGLGQQVDVPGENLERERRGVDPLGAALAALVDVEHAVLVAQRIEVGPEHRMVQPRPAVEHDQRIAGADLLDVEVVAIRQRDLHAKDPKSFAPRPGSDPGRGGSGLGFMPVVAGAHVHRERRVEVVGSDHLLAYELPDRGDFVSRSLEQQLVVDLQHEPRRPPLLP